MWRGQVLFYKCNVSLLNPALCRPGVEAGSRIFEQKGAKRHYAYAHNLTTKLNSNYFWQKQQCLHQILASGPHDDISAVINGCLSNHVSHFVGDRRDLYQPWFYSISMSKCIKPTSAQSAATAPFPWGFSTVRGGRMLFTPRRNRSPEIRACVPPTLIPSRGRGAPTASSSGTTCLKFPPWTDPVSKAGLFSGNQAVLSRLRAEKRKLSVFCVGEQTRHGHLLHLIWCRVAQHCPTCTCFTLESVLLHFSWSQTSLLSFTSSFISVCTCPLKTEIWYSFMNICLFSHSKDFF